MDRVRVISVACLSLMIMARRRGHQFSLVVKQSRTRLRQSLLVEELWDIGTNYQQKLFHTLHIGPLTLLLVGGGPNRPPLVVFLICTKNHLR